MKLSDIAARAIKLLKEAGPEGIHNVKLAQMLGIPRRRVYDLIAVLSAANLIHVKKERGGSRLFWMDALPEASKRIDMLSQYAAKLKNENKSLRSRIATLQRQIEQMKSISEASVKVTEAAEQVKFNTNRLTIRALAPNRITQVYSTGLDAVVESDKPGLVVIPAVPKKEKEKEEEVVV
ncbi:MAG: hypothetical protein J7L47_04720 [Candidatus Odinarchaeota archaeon]|nr:hypothetical protein [Candidatus Odinarchaeota archaeon]